LRRQERREPLRILVTGSSGVVGRAVRPALEKSGHIVVPFDLREPDGRSSVTSKSRDVRRSAAVKVSARDIDGIIHLAAISRGAAAEADPASARSVNIEGTRTVLEAIGREDSPPWLVFASSREVYGDAERLPVSERHPLRPKGIYGETKLEGERLVGRWAASGGRRGLILRFTNLYGDPNDYPERVVPAFVSAARQNLPLHVRGPDVRVDLLQLDDAVSAILAAIRRLTSGASGIDVINVASGHGIRLNELARKIVSLTNSNSTVHEEAPVPWTAHDFVGDHARANELLNWRPRTPLDDGLKTLVGGYSRLGGTQEPPNARAER